MSDPARPRITYDVKESAGEPAPGDFLVTTAGSVYFIERVREVRRRNPQPGMRRYALFCLRSQVSDIAVGARLWTLKWYSRKRKKAGP